MQQLIMLYSSFTYNSRTYSVIHTTPFMVCLLAFVTFYIFICYYRLVQVALVANLKGNWMNNTVIFKFATYYFLIYGSKKNVRCAFVSPRPLTFACYEYAWKTIRLDVLKFSCCTCLSQIFFIVLAPLRSRKERSKYYIPQICI